MDLEDRAVIVTGGSAGIGRSIALTAADWGADVVVADLQREPRRNILPTVEGVREHGVRSKFVKADVTDVQCLEKVAEAAAEMDSEFNAWVNNAGYAETYGLQETPADNWRQSIETNLKGAFNGCQVAAEHFLEGGGGSIVNIASGAGVIGFLNSASYSAAKGGVISLTRQIAVDFAADDLRVNAVSPGFTDTEMLRQDTHDGTEEYATEKTPMGRVGLPEEVANAAVFLLSEKAGFITGQNLVVDGGYTVQ